MPAFVLAYIAQQEVKHVFMVAVAIQDLFVFVSFWLYLQHLNNEISKCCSGSAAQSSQQKNAFQYAFLLRGGAFIFIDTLNSYVIQTSHLMWTHSFLVKGVNYFQCDGLILILQFSEATLDELCHPELLHTVLSSYFQLLLMFLHCLKHGCHNARNLAVWTDGKENPRYQKMYEFQHITTLLRKKQEATVLHTRTYED